MLQANWSSTKHKLSVNKSKANKGRLSNKEFNAILRGKYTPIKYSEARMRKRVRDIEKAFPNEIIDRNFAFPRSD